MKLINAYKQIGVFIFLIALSYQAFQQTLVVCDYYINTNDYIAKCINKAKPKLHCDGKCQMENKLEKANDDDPQKPIKNNHQIVEVVLFFKDLDLFTYLNFEATNRNFYSTQSSKTLDLPHPIFRPPIV